MIKKAKSNIEYPLAEMAAHPQNGTSARPNGKLTAASASSLLIPPRRQGELLPYLHKATVLDGTDAENQISRDRE
jgi:hypothetical protein